MAIIIFISTIAISLYALYRDNSLFDKLVFHPYSIYHNKQYYRIISGGFLHGDITHLLFNMATFYFFAFGLERAFGNFNFIVIYFGSMIISHLPTLNSKKDDYNYSAVGASGAISGLLFSFALFNPFSSLNIMFIPIDIPAWAFAIFYVIYSFYADKHGQDNIGHSAHLYGALGGLVLTIILMPEVLENFFSQVF